MGFLKKTLGISALLGPMAGQLSAGKDISSAIDNRNARPSSAANGSGYTPTYNPEDQIKSIYGSEAERLAEGTGRYMDGLRGNLDKNVANADIYNQVAGRERGIAKAKAGLAGTETSAQDEQARRNSIYGAAATNEAAKRTALSEYGKGVGNVISGVNRLQQQGEANKIASLPVPVAQENKGGLLDGLFGGWLA